MTFGVFCLCCCCSERGLGTHCGYSLTCAAEEDSSQSGFHASVKSTDQQDAEQWVADKDAGDSAGSAFQYGE